MNASSAQRRETDRLVLRLAWPCVLENLSVILISLADAAMIGVLGPAATAAVGVNSSPSWLVSCLVDMPRYEALVKAFAARTIFAKEEKREEP